MGWFGETYCLNFKLKRSDNYFGIWTETLNSRFVLILEFIREKEDAKNLNFECPNY